MQKETVERWRPIPEWEDLYEISDRGSVKHLIPVPRILRPSVDGSGYPFIHMRRPGHRSVTRKVHRMVAAAFIGRCPPSHQVNHKDGYRKNAVVENLEYVTCGENHLHAYRTLKNPARGIATKSRGENNCKAKLTEPQVVEIRSLYAIGNISQQTLADQYGVSQTMISYIVLDRNWKHVSH